MDHALVDKIIKELKINVAHQDELILEGGIATMEQYRYAVGLRDGVIHAINTIVKAQKEYIADPDDE